MIRHVPGPCPACGARELWQGVISGGRVARECPDCGWSAVTPRPGDRPRQREAGSP